MNSYLLFKSLHNSCHLGWQVFCTTRIFVYHSENSNEIISDVFKTMERKLFYYIMTPTMVLSWLFGLVLIHEIGFGQLASCGPIKLFIIVFNGLSFLSRIIT